MASGIFEFGASGYLQAKIEFYATNDWSADNISSNSAPVTAILYARRTNNYSTSGKSWSGYIKLAYQVDAGEEIVEQRNINFSNSVSIGSSWVEMARLESINVIHDSDGSQSIILSGSVTGPQGTSLAGNTSGGTVSAVLDNIPRASKITCADGNIGSATTININRVSTNFRHTLRYEFAGLAETIVEKTAEASWGWTIPTSFYEKIPNSASGSGKIYCDTYNGNSLLGTEECWFNCFVVNSNPTISGTVEDVNQTTITLTGNKKVLVKGFSNAYVNATTQAKNSARVSSVIATCADGNTTNSLPNTFYNVSGRQFMFDIYDSRGFNGTDTVTLEMIPYVKVAITNINVERENSTSNTINVSLSGIFFNNSFGAQDNELTLKWRYKLKNGEWGEYTQIEAIKNGDNFSYSGTLGTDFDFNNAYVFEFVATDKLWTDTKEREVTRGIPLIDLWEGKVNVNGSILENGVEIAKKFSHDWIFDFRQVGDFDVSTSEAIIGYEYADLPKTLEHNAVVIPICSWFKASATASLFDGNCINVFITNYQIHGETAYHGVRALLIYPKSLLN